VLVRRSSLLNDGKSRKLLHKYSGPYKIKKVLDSDRFVIMDIPGSTRSQRAYEGVVALDKLKPYEMGTGSDVEYSSDETD
jgi:hypothetical protein